MKRIRQPKTGRLASESERAVARELVDLYLRAKDAPDRRLCLNPNDSPARQQWIIYDDPSILIEFLDRFASLGTFQDTTENTAARERFMLFISYQFGRQSGESHETAVCRLAGELNLSERTIERHLKESSPSILREWVRERVNDKS